MYSTLISRGPGIGALICLDFKASNTQFLVVNTYTLKDLGINTQKIFPLYIVREKLTRNLGSWLTVNLIALYFEDEISIKWFMGYWCCPWISWERTRWSQVFRFPPEVAQTQEWPGFCNVCPRRKPLCSFRSKDQSSNSVFHLAEL